MTRPSPSVQRVTAVLDFFADHPGQAFTLTDVIRALKLSRATCHALLTGLADSGYLFRANDKSFVIGPRLAAIGRQAEAHFSPLQVAQPEMRRLADHFDVVCSAVFLEGTEIVVRERANSVSHLGESLQRGARLPLRVPFAGVFLAWAGEARLEKWLGQVDPSPVPEALEALNDGIAFAREHGFQIILYRQQHGGRGGRVWPIVEGPEERPVGLETHPEPEQDYPLAAISAPVFHDPETVAFVLTLAGFGRSLRGAQILEAGRELRAACDRIGGFLSGNK